VIREGSGKLYVIEPDFSIDFGWLGTTFFSHYSRHVKWFLMKPSFRDSRGRGRLREWALNCSSEQAPPAGLDASELGFSW
jgi:hypothetical protein